MCGLFGAFSSDLLKYEREDVELLGFISMLRGIHSTGMVVMHEPRANRVEYEVLRETVHALDFYNINNVNKTIYETKNVRALLGHVRAATIGDVTKDNTHPFMCGNIIGMHNGTIMGLADKGKTDSEQLFHMIDKMGLNEAIDALPGVSPAYALAWVDMEEDTINFLRNKERPLWFMPTKKGDTVYYASERCFLDLLNAKTTVVMQTPVMLEADQLITFRLPSMKPTKREVKRKVVEQKTFFPVIKSGGNITTRDSEELPFLPTSRPNIVGPHMPYDPEAAKIRAAPFEVKGITSHANRNDPANTIFQQTPVGGYPRRITLPCIVKKQKGEKEIRPVLKNLWYTDFEGQPQIPNVILPLLNKGCLISGVKATLEDVVYWIDPWTYVMSWHKDDGFVQEYCDGCKPKRGSAIYATLSSVQQNRTMRRAQREEAERARQARQQLDTGVYENEVIIN